MTMIMIMIIMIMIINFIWYTQLIVDPVVYTVAKVRCYYITDDGGILEEDQSRSEVLVC